MISYGSFAPALVASIFYNLGLLYVKIINTKNKFEIKTYKILFINYLFISSIAAFYINQFKESGDSIDVSQNFFFISTSEIKHLPLHEIKSVSEGALAIRIWSIFYDFFKLLGISNKPYIGIYLNILIVSIAGLYGIKTAKLVFGNDPKKLYKVLFFHMSCGLLWIFVSYHFRDAFAFFAITFLLYLWSNLLNKANTKNFLCVLSFTLFAAYFFQFIRHEFMYVPFVISSLGLGILCFYGKRKKLFCLIFGLFTILFFYLFLKPNLEYLIIDSTRAVQGTAELVELETNKSSLAKKLIFNQPFYLKSLLSTIYLFLFPIPFWSGFFQGTAYHFFKSLNVILFYFLIPMVIVSIFHKTTEQNKKVIKNFFLLTIIVFSFLIAATSCETRHLGSFLMPFFICASSPNFQIKNQKKKFVKILLSFFGFIVFLHLLWLLIKIK